MRTYRSPVTLPLSNMRDELMEPDWYGVWPHSGERRGGAGWESREPRGGGGMGGGGDFLAKGIRIH
jgi:hypothetical protein